VVQIAKELRNMGFLFEQGATEIRGKEEKRITKAEEYNG
jgi:hypothetical protein